MTSALKVGFSRIDVTPPLGISLLGYYIDRKAEGVLDNLEANALAIECGEKKVVLITIDNAELEKEKNDLIKEMIAKETGVNEDGIFIHCTHTHTGPGYSLSGNDTEQEIKVIQDYERELFNKCVTASKKALEDLKPAKMGYGVGQAPNVAFIRRFRMKDGSIMTNPGVNNPEILEPIGSVDERVNLLRFDREDGDTIALVNFGNHPDTVGGSKISGDWPSLTRRTLEKAIDGVKCIFFNGAQGDVNHVKVNPTDGDFNGLKNDFDGCSRGYDHARYIGRVVAGAVMQVYDKVNYIDVSDIDYKQKIVRVPSNMPTAEELEIAKKYYELHNAGKDEEIPFKAMMLTTVVAEAKRMVSLENGPSHFDMLLSALRIGDVAIMGFPGEPFTGVGRAIKETDGYKLVVPCCLINSADGYFPMKEAYEEGGYEARSSKFKSGVAEILIEESKKMLEEIAK